MIESAPLLLSSDGYNLNRSVRLRSSATAYFERTPAGAGSLTAWTWSGWVKRGALGVESMLFSAGTGTSNPRSLLSFNATTNTLDFGDNPTGSAWAEIITTAVFRDPAAWYHIVAVYNSANATSTDRLRLYVNGTRITAFNSATYPAQNTSSVTNTAIVHRLGRYAGGAETAYFDGYMTEVNFIGGQALTPTSFGEYNLYGQWVPKKYAGTYGTNGFYLNFNDNSAATATTIGKDSSGLGNNWTPTNISVTAGTSYDSMTDVPTLTSPTTANFSVLNPLVSSSYQNITQGNLATFSNTTTDSGIAVATMGASTGKFYWEVTVSGGSSGYPITGALRNIPASGNGTIPGSSTLGGFSYYTNLGYVLREGSNITTVATSTTNDIIGFALDIDNLQVAIYKNNTLLYTLTGLTAGTYFPATATYASTGVYQNFGQRPFSYTPPTGFVALNTFNM